MFGIQTYFLSKSFTYLIRISLFSIDSSILENNIFLVFILGLNIIDWASIIIAILFQSFLFSIGINFNKKIINYSAIIVYSGILFFFFVILLNDVKITSKAFVEIFNYKNLIDKNNIKPLITIAGTVFAYFSILLLNFGDFSRYVKNEKELKRGNLSLILNLIIFSFFSVFIVIGSDVYLNLKFLDLNSILTSPNDIIGKFDNLIITIIALLFIVVASISTNLVSNFIPSQYSLINFIPSKLNLKLSSFIIGVLGFVVSIFWLSLISQIGVLSFIDTFAAFFGPLFGVMIADYYLIKNKELSNNDIYSVDGEGLYFYSGGWHIKGVYSLFIGFIFSFSTIWNVNLMFLQTYSWIIGAFIAWITYYLLAKK
jgi:NCS1 family nucleobase:cation symporter-1